MLPHDMQRNVFNVDNPPARGSATMNFISAPHRSHFRAGFSSVLSVPITEHYARSARTWLQNVEVSHNQKDPPPDERRDAQAVAALGQPRRSDETSGMSALPPIAAECLT